MLSLLLGDTGINLGLRNYLLLSGFRTTGLWEFLVSRIHTTCCTHREIPVNVYFYTTTLKFVIAVKFHTLPIRMRHIYLTNELLLLWLLAVVEIRCEVYRIGSDDMVIK